MQLLEELQFAGGVADGIADNVVVDENCMEDDWLIVDSEKCDDVVVDESEGVGVELELAFCWPHTNIPDCEPAIPGVIKSIDVNSKHSP